MGGRPPPARPPKSATAAAASRARSPEPRPSRSRAGGGAMACAGLLTVCLIRPPAPEPPRPPAPAAGPAGHALFQDMMVSSHLKNSRITLPMGFSAPGSCESCSAALMGIPLTIWKQRSCVVSRPMGALVFRDLWADYFSEHLGVYRPVLAALESLNCAVLAAMDTTKLEYERASKVDQFVTRFLLRETVSQLQALQSSLEGASDTLEAQAHGPCSSREAPSLKGPVSDPQGGAQRPRCSGGSRSTVSRSSSTSSSARPPGWNPCMKRSLPRVPTRTSLWPKGRCRWQRKPCRTSTMPCAATWTSQGPRAIACMCLPRRCWTMPPSPCMSSGRMRPPGEGTSSLPAVRPSSASSSTTCGLQTPSPPCSSQPPGGL
ncbi:N-terminal EF-hand calcium-binding protein 3 isoform X5 [Hippopotamus amphibius kiboko]|uniref:N-terminal EF-hand calcium-binding protein 3 isoform X5 n=1 Tax=Hippopotamus amphibius kiboko TaxID=575201 RepID=UPI0025934D23|nr:N-terminal EF-hand calcium-binding protein 3 isoform X5 [Hippopotamus amphibius kiboko]